MFSGLIVVRRVTPVPVRFADDADDAVLRRLSGRGDAFAFLGGIGGGMLLPDEGNEHAIPLDEWAIAPVCESSVSAGGNTGGSISDEDVDGVRLCGELFAVASTGIGGGSACVGEPIVVAGSTTEERLIESCAFASAEWSLGTTKN